MRASRDEIIAYFFQLKKDNPSITIDEVKTLVLEKYQSESVPSESSHLALPKRCVKCGAHNQESALYCSACGGKMPKASEPLPRHSGDSDHPAGKTEIGELRDGILVCKCCGQKLPTDSPTSNVDGTGESTVAMPPPRRQSYAGVICSYCEKRIEYRQKVIVCPECGDPHHIECWRDNQCQCSVPNCPGQMTLEEPEPVYPVNPEGKTRRKFPFNLFPTLDIWEKEEEEEEYDPEDFFRQEPQEHPKPRRKKNWVLILLMLLLLAACAGLIWMVMQKHGPDLGMTPTEFKLRYNREENTIVRALNGVSVLRMNRIMIQDRGNYKVFIMSNERHALVGVVNDDGKLRAILTGGRYFTQNDQFVLARLWHATIGVFSTEPIVNASGLLNLEEITRRTLLTPSMMDMENNEQGVTLKPAELWNAKCGWVTTKPNDRCYLVICNVEDNIEELARALLDTDVLMSTKHEES